MLSFANTSITGAPKPIVIRIFVPAAASFCGVGLADPVLVRQVHEQRDARLDGRVHRRRAHGVHLHVDADLLAFVEHGAQHLELLRARAGHRRQRDLARVLDARAPSSRELLRARASGVVLGEPQALRRNDARTVDLAGLDVLAQRDVAVAGAAAGENRRVAGLELALHLRLLLGPGVDVPVRVDEARHRAHALGVDDLAARAARGAPAATDTILPPRTTIEPRSMTVPLPTTMRALVIVRSCAAAGAAAPSTKPQSQQRRSDSVHVGFPL